MPFLGAAHIQFLVQDGVEKPDPFGLGRTLMDYISSEPHRVSWVCCLAHFAAQLFPLPNPASFPFSSVSQGHSLINILHNKPHLGYVLLGHGEPKLWHAPKDAALPNEAVSTPHRQSNCIFRWR